MTTISQASDSANLEWVEHDPVSLAFVVAGVDWSGTYGADVRRKRRETSERICTLIVGATYDGTDTSFTMTLSRADSASVHAGSYFWDLQQTNGVTRLRGAVTVLPGVTP